MRASGGPFDAYALPESIRAERQTSRNETETSPPDRWAKVGILRKLVNDLADETDA
jgi:hypothetical protein